MYESQDQIKSDAIRVEESFKTCLETPTNVSLL